MKSPLNDMKFIVESKLKNLFGSPYQNLNEIEISSKNLVENHKYLSELSSLKIAPVLKSNAYGHGVIEVGKILKKLGTPFLCVDSLFEAYKLYEEVKAQILIMGYTDPENLKIKKLPFSYCVFDLEFCKSLNKYQPGSKVHVFVDTGMGREGISVEDLENFILEVKKLKSLEIEGLMSHLASTEPDSLKNQVGNFKTAVDTLKKLGIETKWRHISASYGLLEKDARKKIEEVSNLARVGIALYGAYPDRNLRPVLRFITKIVQIKKLRKGDKVGYDGTFTAPSEMMLAILPAGYNDGVDRRLSNKGVASIDGRYCPIVGLVSMNLMTIDISSISKVFVGQEVVIYSDNPGDKNSIINSALLCKTIPYELLIHLNSFTKRLTGN